MNKNNFRTVLLVAVIFLSVVILSKNTSAAEWSMGNYASHLCQGQVAFDIGEVKKVDCVTATHAIAYVLSDDWATGLGRALHWAAVTGKRPGIVVIIDPEGQSRDLAKLKSALHSIPGIEVTVWPTSTRI